MKQRTIDTAREARLWIRDIIVPAVGVIAFVALNAGANERFRSVMDHIRNRKPVGHDDKYVSCYHQNRSRYDL